MRREYPRAKNNGSVVTATKCGFGLGYAGSIVAYSPNEFGVNLALNCWGLFVTQRRFSLGVNKDYWLTLKPKPRKS